jgi:hypothetical protein
MNERIALLVGIDNYPGRLKLRGCINDAKRLSQMLATHGNGSPNFSDIKLKKDVARRSDLRAMIIRFFSSDATLGIFYFAGHGYLNERGGYIVTPDFDMYDEGIPMDELLAIANESLIRHKIIILDCCHSGAIGTPKLFGGRSCIISEGVTIITACRQAEQAIESGANGVFTSLLLDALHGGAADAAGYITPGNIYSYVDRSLSLHEQRPMFKTNISSFISVRNVVPRLPRTSLVKLTDYFANADDRHALNPSYEFTNHPDKLQKLAEPFANKKNVVIMQNLQKMVKAGLVVPVGEDHMYFAAMNSKSCKLTPLGQHYWRILNKQNKK